MFKTQKLKIIFTLLYFLFSISVAKAASFSVSPQDLIAGKEAAVVLSLDTENQEINAVELRLKFSGDDFLIKDVSDGNSLINLWVEKPRFSNPPAGGQNKGEIYFSGIIPGGFQGKDGQLAKIILIPQKSGEASFEIAEAKALLNDGKGTEADVKISNFQFLISKQTPDSTFYFPDSEKDVDSPEDFAPQIASDPNIFGGKYFLIFATQDKNSGIDYYKILEKSDTVIYGIESLMGLEKDGWIITGSPYLLQDQKLRSHIYVKAVDKAGNARVAAVPARNPMVWYENYLMYGIIILVAIIGHIIGRKLWKKNTK